MNVLANKIAPLELSGPDTGTGRTNNNINNRIQSSFASAAGQIRENPKTSLAVAVTAVAAVVIAPSILLTRAAQDSNPANNPAIYNPANDNNLVPIGEGKYVNMTDLALNANLTEQKELVDDMRNAFKLENVSAHTDDHTASAALEKHGIPDYKGGLSPRYNRGGGAQPDIPIRMPVSTDEILQNGFKSGLDSDLSRVKRDDPSIVCKTNCDGVSGIKLPDLTEILSNTFYANASLDTYPDWDDWCHSTGDNCVMNTEIVNGMVRQAPSYN